MRCVFNDRQHNTNGNRNGKTQRKNESQRQPKCAGSNRSNQQDREANENSQSSNIGRHVHSSLIIRSQIDASNKRVFNIVPSAINLLVPATLRYAEPITMSEQTMTDQEFRNRADSALETLRKRLQQLGDEYNFEVEGDGGRLDLLFEEPEETRFVISPNAPVRQIWISALTTSFKLSWSDATQTFGLEKSGENLAQVMSRILSQQLGQKVIV